MNLHNFGIFFLVGTNFLSDNLVVITKKGVQYMVSIQNLSIVKKTEKVELQHIFTMKTKGIQVSESMS